MDVRPPVPLDHPRDPTGWVFLFLCSRLLRIIELVHQSMLCGFPVVLIVFHVRVVRVVVSQGSYEQNSIHQRATDEVAHHLDPLLHPQVPSIRSLGKPLPQRCHREQRGSCSLVRLAG